MLVSLLFLVSITQSKKQPNVLFILVDDLGWDNVGFHAPNDNEVVSPNIDYLASNGLELNRHYVYFYCSPTRASFQSGRLPIHVGIADTPQNETNAGIPQNMTTIGIKMQEAGFTTHMFGKYDIGMATETHTPKGRGYNSSLIYYHHRIQYFTQWEPGECSQYDYSNNLIDFWQTKMDGYNGPAKTLNGTNYVDFLFADKVYDVLDSYNNSNDDKDPFFMVFTPHVAHAPLQIPKEYLEPFNFDNDENECKNVINQAGNGYIYPGFNDSSKFKCRSTYHAMVALLDGIIGNVTKKLKDNGLWNDTLIVFSSDNGGPLSLGCCGGNNHPLRGGKHSVWEGGVRAAAFVSGGYLPENRRGKVENGMIAIADWYGTFCEMFGVSPVDSNAVKHGLPPVDSVNIWPLIIGQNSTSPRTEIPINSQALIQGNYKYIVGDSITQASWAGITYPNSSSPSHQVSDKMNCNKGCLFDVVQDMTEHVDIANENPSIVQNMSARLDELIKDFFNNKDNITMSCPSNVTEICACWFAKNYYGEFWGPYCLG